MQLYHSGELKTRVVQKYLKQLLPKNYPSKWENNLLRSYVYIESQEFQ